MTDTLPFPPGAECDNESGHEDDEKRPLADWHVEFPEGSWYDSTLCQECFEELLSIVRDLGERIVLALVPIGQAGEPRREADHG